MHIGISGVFARTRSCILLSTFKKVTRSSALAALTLAISATGLADTFYKWKNEAGVWSYGEHPPQGVEAIAINTTSGSNRSEHSDDQASASATEEGSTDQPPGTPEYFVTKTAKVPKKEKERLCKAAKANLETLESAAVIRKRDANGEVTVITDEERQSEIENARQTIKDFC